MAHDSDLPCDGDGCCMICKIKPPVEETLNCKTCVTSWHLNCLSARPQTLADVAQWECPDCSNLVSSHAPPSTVTSGSEPSDTLVAAIRAIESDASLLDKEKAKRRQQLLSAGGSDDDDKTTDEKKEIVGRGGQGKRTYAICRTSIPPKMANQTKHIPQSGQRILEKLMHEVGRYSSQLRLIILDPFLQRMTQREEWEFWLGKLGRIVWNVDNGGHIFPMLLGFVGSLIMVQSLWRYLEDTRMKRIMDSALRVSCKKGYPVRVVRSHKEKRSAYSPDKGVRYDGIYRIEKCWRKPGIQGYKVCRYLFVRCDNDPAPWTSDENGDRPRPLPTIKELKDATDVTDRKSSPSWDFIIHNWYQSRT
ncbi:hypothetical protein L6452_36333 [Arctium lappa]|uniref:Uncharacterized protein n=1 Tax=Arctium lappa TaxID=4217 RepID=A0ACB8YA15_ARCLA|nr:hypothetical protein L6452_36333 [Arctium lappa]